MWYHHRYVIKNKKTLPKSSDVECCVPILLLKKTCRCVEFVGIICLQIRFLCDSDHLNFAEQRKLNFAKYMKGFRVEKSII